MSSTFDKLRTQIADDLGRHRIGVLSAADGELGPQAMPVQYRLTDTLEVECLVPRWSELAYALEQHGPVMLVVLSAPDGDQRWIRYQGSTQPVPAPDWARLLPDERAPADRYTVVRIRPTRIELFDQQKGWGARDTLDLD